MRLRVRVSDALYALKRRVAPRRGHCWRWAAEGPHSLYCGRHGRAAGWPCTATVGASGPAAPVTRTMVLPTVTPWSDPTHDVIGDLRRAHAEYERRWIEGR